MYGKIKLSESCANTCCYQQTCEPLRLEELINGFRCLLVLADVTDKNLQILIRKVFAAAALIWSCVQNLWTTQASLNLTFATSERTQEQNALPDDILVDVFEDFLRVFELLGH